MNKTKRPTKPTLKTISLFTRYIIIILAGLGNLFIFYKIFTPLTVYPVGFLLKLLAPTTITANLITFQSIIIEIIPACVAGAAYYFLFILAISVPDIKLSKRIKIISFSFTLLLILNILRIFLLSAINQSIYFHSLHILFWYVLSIVFVFVIWLITIKTFKINQVPVWDDLRFLIKLTKKKR